MSSLRRQLLSKFPAPEPLNESDEEPSQVHGAKRRTNYSPANWEDYFAACRNVPLNEGRDVFRVYETCASDGPLFIFHHGAGQAALSFGLTAAAMRDAAQGACSLVAYDCRGHGHTVTEDDDDLSLTRLSDDLASIVAACRTNPSQDVILVGHSMGGAVVVDAVKRGAVSNITGVVVLDVVEGSALESLAYMTAFVQSRPRVFKTLEAAIEWSVRSGGVHNPRSARLSVPPLLRTAGKEHADGEQEYVWRTDLGKTAPFWEGWFKDLSGKFLGCSASKLLVLANTDRLDNPLMIGQMQGKFQLIVLQNCGHHLQEDAPDRLASTLLEFHHRFRRLALPIKRFPISEKRADQP
ncbi:carboxyl methyl esterase [Thamnocephalis sphaerospora]|uniref:Protein phosphatase methylesterase 1 n=1 Tax=Thamnocephalis sphaerospora TaxID=78915 RepID=A0A4P9XWU7_9FUNG|nr:carboxyl methyl esterase [Thamnocephalis sphaerospora]|eukprot:RKP10903.1 carboxyl methyl esterase [Thamnocephalis sphaerospora]